MAAKYEVPMALMTPSAKKDFLDDCFQKHKELNKFQREYKKILSMRFMTRTECIVEKSYLQALARLRSERNDLRAQIWVANGRLLHNEDRRCLEQIKCHVKCQESLRAEIKKLKVAISNLEHHKSVTDKQIYNLNLKTVPDMQHQTYVERGRKKLMIYENRLEVGVRQECKFATENAELREVIKALRNQREQFNMIYSTLVQNLNCDKKYLMELLEYAMNVFEEGIQVNEKIANSLRKSFKDSEQAKLAMQSAMRNRSAADLVNEFLSSKNKVRVLADLQPKEKRRRLNVKRHHKRKTDLYNKVLYTIFKFSGTENIDEVIEKYQEQEGLYYSFSSYVNDTSHHIAFLEAAINRLFNNVQNARIRNDTTLRSQKDNIRDLQLSLEECKNRNEALNTQLLVKNKQLEELLQAFATIFGECRVDVSPLMALLGDQSCVNLQNMRSYLKLFEERILNIVRSIYIMTEYHHDKKPDICIVSDLQKLCESPTDLNNIVLTQQCPECAEGEAFNIDGGDAGIAVTTVEETKAKLFETVNQPDMQYRLHSISQCRLPRSRFLASKRYT